MCEYFKQLSSAISCIGSNQSCSETSPLQFHIIGIQSLQAMATYADVESFKQFVNSFTEMTREDFLYHIKKANFIDYRPFHDLQSAKGVSLLWAFGMAPESLTCQCGQQYVFGAQKVKSRAEDPDEEAKGSTVLYYWRQQKKTPCPICLNRKVSVVENTMFQGMATDHWMDFLDVVTMWCLEYPRAIMVDELNHLSPVTIDAWCDWCQGQVGKIPEDRIVLTTLKDTLQLHRTQSNQAKPRGKYCKRPAASKAKAKAKAKAKTVKKPAAKKKPSVAILRPRHLRNKLVVQWDETLALGSRKKSRLAKQARPKRNQLWIGGSVVEDHPDMFFFRVLEYPIDAYDGKPRGKMEMKICLESIGLDKDMILVTDKWKSTVAAIKQIKAEKGWTDTDLPVEIVNHSGGEIVNAHGFSTNQIEVK